MGIERPRGTECSPVASTSDDGQMEKVDRVRIMKEIPNGVENTGNSYRLCFPLFSPLFLHPARLPPGTSVTGLIVNWTWKVSPQLSVRHVESQSLHQVRRFAVESAAIGGFYLQLARGKNARESRRLASPGIMPSAETARSTLGTLNSSIHKELASLRVCIYPRSE